MIKIILNSQNKTKTTWSIVKTETGKNESKEGMHLLNINGIIHTTYKLLQIHLMIIS
jgi:hypothetical protein